MGEFNLTYSLRKTKSFGAYLFDSRCYFSHRERKAVADQEECWPQYLTRCKKYT